MENFPPVVPLWGTDTITSQMRLRIRAIATGEEEETNLQSSMELKRGRPYLDEDGRRRIDVQIESWSATGFSNLMNGPVEYRLADREQPMSSVQADTAESDYPATMRFSAYFDFYFQDEPLMTGLDGTAQAEGMDSIPPRGHDVFFPAKRFQTPDFDIEPVQCGSSALQLKPMQRRMVRVGTTFGLISRDMRDHL